MMPLHINIWFIPLKGSQNGQLDTGLIVLRRVRTHLDTPAPFPARASASAPGLPSVKPASPISHDTAAALSGWARGRLLWKGANP